MKFKEEAHLRTANINHVGKNHMLKLPRGAAENNLATATEEWIYEVK
jgi:hypothetical protein